MIAAHTFTTLASFGHQLFKHRNLIFGSILMVALVAFEAFNYSTTYLSLDDLLGNLQFWGIRWASILSVAFCGIDFAGLARIFTPESKESLYPRGLWLLLSAWFLAGTMNALLTWWGVSVAILAQGSVSKSLINPTILNTTVPIVVAIIVWVTRILLIGTFSAAGTNLFSSTASEPSYSRRPEARQVNHPLIKTHDSAYSGRSPAVQPRPTINRLQKEPSPSSPEPEYIREPALASYSPANPKSPVNDPLPSISRRIR